MDFKEIKNTKHYLYDSKEEFAITFPDIPIRHNWRHGEEGEWVFTDDNFVCQILRKFNIERYNGKKDICVRTVCGTFKCKNMKKNMLGDNGISENIYAFSGNNDRKNEYKNHGYTSRELLFARYVAKGVDNLEAYKKAFPGASSEHYIKTRCRNLLKTEKIDKMIDKEIRKKLDEEGATDNYLIERYKTLADGGETDHAKLKALDSLAKISGLFDKETKKEQVTIWAGFSPEQLEGVKEHGKPELIAHAEKNEKE